MGQRGHLTLIALALLVVGVIFVHLCPYLTPLSSDPLGFFSFVFYF